MGGGADQSGEGSGRGPREVEAEPLVPRRRRPAARDLKPKPTPLTMAPNPTAARSLINPKVVQKHDPKNMNWNLINFLVRI